MTAARIPAQRDRRAVPPWTPQGLRRHREKFARSMAWLVAYRHGYRTVPTLRMRLEAAQAELERERVRGDLGTDLARLQRQVAHISALLLSEDENADAATGELPRQTVTVRGRAS